MSTNGLIMWLALAVSYALPDWSKRTVSQHLAWFIVMGVWLNTIMIHFGWFGK